MTTQNIFNEHIIRKENTWPEATRARRLPKVGKYMHVYKALKEMREGDVISIPISTSAEAQAVRSGLSACRKAHEDVVTGYQSQLVRNKEGGMRLYLKRIHHDEMRNWQLRGRSVPRREGRISEVTYVPTNTNGPETQATTR